MKPLLHTLAFCLAAMASLAQSGPVKEIQQSTPPAAALAPLRFLASDELMGRGNTRPEIHIAARYIGEQFRSAGVKELKNAPDYFQTFQIKMFRPASVGSLVVGKAKPFEMGKTLLQLRGEDISIDAPVIYIGYGQPEAWDKADVKGKIVVADLLPDSTGSVRREIRGIDARHKLAKDKGALALVLRYKGTDITWDQALHYLSGERVWSETPITPPVYLVNDDATNISSQISADTKGKLIVSGNKITTFECKNVAGFVEGTDTKLKEQFIVLSAHYDHLGISDPAKLEDGTLDSIYNGARDNALGVAAVINAAKYFSKYPPRRSVLFIGYTAEEIGLGGSSYFAANPLIPLKQIVYNLNIDNGGYNDTTRISLVGKGRTSADEDIKKACDAFGLTLEGDPAPEQNLFDRSDNVSLAIKGIPAPTFGMGIKTFDATIMKHYHQAIDEVDDMDLKYSLKYLRAYILAAKHIADNTNQPTWKSGDKYEPAWKALYGK